MNEIDLPNVRFAEFLDDRGMVRCRRLVVWDGEQFRLAATASEVAATTAMRLVDAHAVVVGEVPARHAGHG